MNAFEFGRRVRVKLAAGPGLPAPTSSLTGQPTLPHQAPPTNTTGTMSLARPGTPAATTTTTGGSTSQPPRAPSSTTQPKTYSFNKPTWGDFGKELMTSRPGTGYGAVLDRWYNPWTKQEVKEKGEKGLMRAGQVSGAVGAIAGLAAGGIAAAPAFGLGGGAAATGSAGTTAATSGTGLVAASQTPAGQQFMNRAGQFATQAQQTLGNLSANYFTRVEPTLNRIGYKPEDVAMDGAAVLTGNFDKIKGPGWGFKTPSLPQGAPSLPRPLEAWRSYYGADPGAPAGVARAGM